MAGFPVVVVDSGGIPVTEAENGTPYTIADNGYGVAVTFVSSGGIPLTLAGLTPNPVTSGLWSAFYADDPATLSLRVSGADTFVTSWNDDLGDVGKTYDNATEADQPAIVRDANGIPCIRFDGTSDILNGSAGQRDWLRGQDNATIVIVSRQRSTPSAVERVFVMTVNDGANPAIAIDCTTGGVRRVQCRRVQSSAATTLTTGITIPTTAQREAVRFRPVDGRFDYIGDDLVEQTSSAMATSGTMPDVASQASSYGATGSLIQFCDVDIYCVLFYRGALTAPQLAEIWDWAAQRYSL